MYNIFLLESRLCGPDKLWEASALETWTLPVMQEYFHTESLIFIYYVKDRTQK